MIERERLAETGLPAHERVYRAAGADHARPGAAWAALTLRGIAAEFGVSMTPAREAVRRLVAEGAEALGLRPGLDAGARQRAHRGAGGAPR